MTAAEAAAPAHAQTGARTSAPSLTVCAPQLSCAQMEQQPGPAGQEAGRKESKSGIHRSAKATLSCSFDEKIAQMDSLSGT